MVVCIKIFVGLDCRGSVIEALSLGAIMVDSYYFCFLYIELYQNTLNAVVTHFTECSINGFTINIRQIYQQLKIFTSNTSNQH